MKKYTPEYTSDDFMIGQIVATVEVNNVVPKGSLGKVIGFYPDKFQKGIIYLMIEWISKTKMSHGGFYPNRFVPVDLLGEPITRK